MGMRLKTIEKLIISELPPNGSAEGNVSLFRRLSQRGMTETEFWSGQQSLLKKGNVLSGRGRGGSIRLATASSEIEVSSSNQLGNITNIGGSNKVQQLILEYVPSDGTSIGNRAIISKLSKHGIDEEEYWVERNALIDEGKLSKGRGYGGSILRGEVTAVLTKEFPEKFSKENSLYSHFNSYITQVWMKHNNLKANKTVCEITAHKGQKKTGGQWTRPDVTVITVRTYQFVPGKQLEVITFEVKPAGALDLQGAYETTAHSRFAHKSYLAVYLPDKKTLVEEKFARLRQECARFGLGLIHFENPEKLDSYEVDVEPERKNPDPDKVDEFINDLISEHNKTELRSLI